MSRALRDLHVLFEDASHIALSSPAAAPWREGGPSVSSFTSAFRPKPGRVQFAGFNSSHGVVQRLPLRRHTLRASTPGGSWFDANAVPLAPFGLGLPPPGSFRPCRSSRLRRLPPLERRRLVASCSRPWGSLRFCLDDPHPFGFPLDRSNTPPQMNRFHLRYPRSVRSEIPISDHPPKASPPPQPRLVSVLVDG